MGGAGAIARLRLRRRRPSTSIRSTWSPVRATTSSPRPSVPSPGVVGNGLRGRRDRDPRSSPTTAPIRALVAADLISQAEHDEQASAVLVTDLRRSPTAVGRRDRPACGSHAARRARRGRRWPARSRRSCSSTTCAAATAFSNAYAPEHLELHLADPRRGVRSCTPARSSSATDSPVSLGDYLAGSNHVLPTGGQARYAAGLRRATFLRPQQVIEYDRAALAAGARARSSRSRRPRSCPRTARPSQRASRLAAAPISAQSA